MERNAATGNGSQTTVLCEDCGFQVLLCVEDVCVLDQFESILTSHGFSFLIVNNAPELRQVLAANRNCLPIVSPVFSECCADVPLKSGDGDKRNVPFILWVDSKHFKIDDVAAGLRRGAIDVFHGSLSEQRLLKSIEIARLRALPNEHTRKPEYGQAGLNGCGNPVGTPSSPARFRAAGEREVPGNDVWSIDFLEANEVGAGPGRRMQFDRVSKEDRSASCAAPGVADLEDLILGESEPIKSVRRLILKVAPTKATVMVFGESGTGKERVANAIHLFSKRSKQPFVPVNVSAIPEGLAESLLFGHEKGAFTTAHQKQPGWCAMADGGTLFLDEVGELSLTIQPKLLRFLQEGTVQTIGARSSSKVDVRLITATNRDPKSIVEEGRLREDLFFRLNVVPILIPPLRERREDISILANFFLQKSAERHERRVLGFTEAAMAILKGFDWPGNVRQLENIVERLVIFADGELIEPRELPAEFHSLAPYRNGRICNIGNDVVNGSISKSNGVSFNGTEVVDRLSLLQLTERSAMINALQQANGHVVSAAAILGIGQATMYRKIKQYALPYERKRQKVSPK